jgi:glucose/arabinose dehydrogenase
MHLRKSDHASSRRVAIQSVEPRILFSTLPAGFTETQVASGLSSPSAMDMSPDGRLFFTDQAGHIRIIQNDQLLATPFADLSAETDSASEHGLLGIALDPNFSTNQFIYIFYSANSPTLHNRIARITADPNNPNQMLAGSEVDLMDLPDIAADSPFRMGGSLQFGPDGKLYVSVGDEGVADVPQSLNSVFGKILRINTDGSIPTDDPFYNQTTGNNRAIWALGLRNPYTTAFQPGTGRFFIDDVGQSTWEEIDDGAAGANYGWSTTEGAFNQASFPNFTEPFYTYQHLNGRAAITGGAFYDPTTAQFPSQYVGKYFFDDFGSGELMTIDPTTKVVSPFGTGLSFPEGIHVGNDGSMYYLSRGAQTGGQPDTGGIFKITYQAPPPATYISDLPFAQTPTNGWGVPERDRSNGETGASDGHTITLNGVTYQKGLGVHAASDVRFNINGQYTHFLSDIGLDDEIGNAGSVDFQVFGDNSTTPLYDSGVMTGASATKSIDVNVTNVNVLRLVVTDGGNGNNSDHADWANARLTSQNAAPPPSVPPVSLSAPTSYSTGSESHGVSTMDVNHDGNLDLLVANAGSSSVSVLLGKGDGTFLPAVNYGTGNTPKSVFAGDLNGDGIPDLVTPNQTDGTVSVLINNGDGTFKQHVDYTATSGAHEAQLADVDGDGDLDIVETGWGDTLVRVLFNNGHGVFSGGTNYTVGNFPTSLQAVDFNGDGKPDIAVTGYDSNNVAVLINKGNGTFNNAVFYPVANEPHSMRSADINGDGKVDLATADESANSISVLYGNGNGTFQPVVNYPAGLGPKGVGIGDLNGDGKLDLVSANADGNYPDGNNPAGATISVLLNEGNGIFAAPQTFNVGTTPFSVAIGDFNKDGDMDLATANWHTNDVTVLTNLLFSSQQQPPQNSPPTANADSASTTINQPVTINVLGNDSDSDGSLDATTVAITTSPANGNLSVNPTTGAITYTPTQDFTGADSFFYTVKDNLGAVSSPAKVSLAVNDPQTAPVYLSDLNYTVVANGWGPPEKDRSNGETGAADGHTITLNGTTYAKGLGVHANSDVRLNLNGAYTQFTSDVGVDDEAGNNGSVDFQIYVDNVLKYDSGTMTGASATQSTPAIDLIGASTLRLVVTDAGNGNTYDHADWAGAQLIPSGNPTPPTPPTNTTTYISDLPFAQTPTNGWGPPERDRSNGETGAADGHTITLNGVTYTKGLGVHAASDVRFNLNGQYTHFTADIGLDDEIGNNGSVDFQIFGDSSTTPLYDSGTMTGASATKSIDVNITGVNVLRLVVKNVANNIDYDHADWANGQVS